MPNFLQHNCPNFALHIKYRPYTFVNRPHFDSLRGGECKSFTAANATRSRTTFPTLRFVVIYAPSLICKTNCIIMPAWPGTTLSEIPSTSRVISLVCLRTSMLFSLKGTVCSAKNLVFFCHRQFLLVSNRAVGIGVYDTVRCMISMILVVGTIEVASVIDLSQGSRARCKFVFSPAIALILL